MSGISHIFGIKGRNASASKWHQDHGVRFYFSVQSADEMERLGRDFSAVAIESYREHSALYKPETPMLIALDSQRCQGMGKSTFASGVLEALAQGGEVRRGYRVGQGGAVHYDTPMWSDIHVQIDEEDIQIQSVDYIHGRRNEPSSDVPTPRRMLSGLTLCEHLDLNNLEDEEQGVLPFMLSFHKSRFVPNALAGMWNTKQRVVCLQTDEVNAQMPGFQKFLEDNRDLSL
ncbi:MAG: hypothetical protein ACTHOO_06110 [Alcanivorax sp.]